MGGIPLIHAIENVIGLMDYDARAFGQNVQFTIGNDSGDFDDRILIRIESGHLQVHPYEILFRSSHPRKLNRFDADGLRQSQSGCIGMRKTDGRILPATARRVVAAVARKGIGQFAMGQIGP